uniref:Uncharacterized protein n=1 Tax=Plectus sambesii TaxID=2011161 RepID=A0A914W2W1_9BILA
MATKTGVFIVGAKRTAFGTFGGKLKGHSSTDLAEIASRAALKSASIAPEHVDHVVMANNAGNFKAEITPITLKSKKGEVVFEVDEHPRETTNESLAKLPPVFQKNGLVTAGNASGICDGAAAVVVASESAVKKLKLTPLARIVAWHAVGCDPSIMGIGPAPAIRGVLEKAKMKLSDIDLIEVNEAFAAQAVAVRKELGIDQDKFNVSGGAIALGHPLAASGTRISAHLVHELKRRGAKFGIGSACIGGGQGIAIIFESIA